MSAVTITRMVKVTVVIAIATTFNEGWDAFFAALPVGAVIRSVEALRGWKAAKEQAIAIDVDYR